MAGILWLVIIVLFILRLIMPEKKKNANAAKERVKRTKINGKQNTSMEEMRKAFKELRESAQKGVQELRRELKEELAAEKNGAAERPSQPAVNNISKPQSPTKQKKSAPKPKQPETVNKPAAETVDIDKEARGTLETPSLLGTTEDLIICGYDGSEFLDKIMKESHYYNYSSLGHN